MSTKTSNIQSIPGTELSFGYGDQAVIDAENSGISFGYGDQFTNASIPPSTDDATLRANKWHYGLGNSSPGLGILLTKILRGEEGQEEKIQAEIDKTNREIIKQQVMRAALTDKTGAFTPEDIEGIKHLSLSPVNEKPQFFPQNYAERVVNDSMSTKYAGLPVSEKEYRDMDVAQRVIAIKEGAQRVAEDMKARMGNLSGLETAANVVGQFVPLLQGARLRDSFFALTGNDLTNQYATIYSSVDPAKGIEELTKRAEELYAQNPITAMEYLNGFLSYSSSEAAMANIWSIVDFASTPGIGLAGKLAKGTAVSAAGALKGVVKANNSSKALEVKDMLAASGNLRGAATLDAGEKLAIKAANQGTLPLNTFNELEVQTYTLTNAVGNITHGVRADMAEASQRIVRNVEYGKKLYEDNLLNQSKTRRLDPSSTAKRVADAETDAMWRIEYPHLVDRIMNVRSSNLEDTVTSNWYRVYELGDEVSQKGSKSQASGIGVTNQGTKGEEIAIGKAANTNAGRKPNLVATGSKETKGFDVKANNDNIKTEIARYDLQPFETKEAGERAAREDFKLRSYRVVEKGDGFVVEVVKPVDEKLVSVRNALMEETGNIDPKSWYANFVNALQTSNPFATVRGMTSKGTRFDDGLMREAQSVSFSMHPTQELINAIVEPIHSLRSTAGKKDWEDFKTLLARQRVQHNKDTGQLGVFSNDMGQLDSAYHQNFGRVATPSEHAAYWAYRQINDIDYVSRNLQLYTQKVAQGRQTFTIDGLSVEGKSIPSLPFDANVDTGFVTWNKDPSQITFNTLRRTGEKERNDIKDRIAKGELKVVQIPRSSYDQIIQNPLYKDHLGEYRFNYMLVDNYEVSPLSYKQVPYREGGHHINEHAYFLRQPDLKPLTGRGDRSATVYLGDVNVHGFMSEKEGNLFAKRFNEARNILRESGDDTSYLRDYLNANLPYSVDSFKKFFTKNGGPLKIEQELFLTPSNTNVDKAHKLEDMIKMTDPSHVYIRASDNPHDLDAGNTWTKFMQERGEPMSSVINEGTKERPLFKVEAPKLMDPMASVMRSASDVLQSRGFDDLRVRSAEQFIAQFHEVLAWDITKLRANPMQALMEAPFKEGSTRAEIAAAKDFRRGALEMLSIKSEAQANIDAMHQRLVESILGKVPDKNSWTGWGLSKIKDPAAAMRAVAFEVKQGMFSPTAFINQAMIVNHIAGIEGPVVALRSALASNMARSVQYLDQSPAMLSKAAKISGMEEKHFLEMWNALQQSGFTKVGREVADRGDWLTPAMGEGKFEKFLDWGRFFFKQGESLGRHTAYSAAYNKWRLANPLAEFDDLAKATVLQRANFLNLEMTGINNSSLQSGLPGVVTQFFTAHFRQAEQMLGTRLTRDEKTRWIAWNSFMFGIPAAAGGAIGIWPVANSVREGMNESGWINAKGWHPNDSVTMNLLINGAISAVSEPVTGMQFNTSNLSLGGASLFRDLMHGKKDYLEFLGGVSGRTMSDFWKTTQPLFWAITSVGQDNKYTLSVEDARDFLGNISSLGTAEKVFSAVMLGKYFNREGVRLDNINTYQGLIIGLTGVQPQSITNLYDQLSSIQQDKERQKSVEKEFGQNIRKAFEALDRNDDEGFGYHMRNANFNFIRGNFRPDQRMQMIQRALNDNNTLAEKVQRKFMQQMNTPQHLEASIKQVEKKQR